ncbi:MAG TPA: long-chain fatty acid--CoA ligase [Gemmatimonadales bacterium]|nr:long-chain fatty acid--CoA ligase [Gemmatimonadales bacterium]
MTATIPTSHQPDRPVVPLVRYEHDTLLKIFYGGLDRFGGQEALRFKRAGAWHSLSYREVEQQVARIAAALRVWGLRPGDRVAILSENRPEWAVADYATLAVGGVVVPIYPTLPPDQVAFILRDSGARIVFLSTAAQVDKIRQIRDQVPSLERVITFDPAAPEFPAESMARVLETTEADLPWLHELRKRSLGVPPDTLATIIYTSGTTGVPKGVMLTHGNIAATIAASKQHGALPVEPGQVALSLLPLSHIFERACDYFLWDNGVTIAYAESIQAVPANLLEVRPQVMISVPRLFDKVYTKVMNTPGLKGRLLHWAGQVGGTVVDARLSGGRASLWVRVQYWLADLLVFRKIRHLMGGRLTTMISGGAPLSPAVARFFHAAGLPIHEGYGLTETSPVLAANRAGAIRLGTVGPIYPGVEIRIDDTGEILARGPNVMLGYWNNPEATAQALDSERWFHTGDVGEIDREGFLRITDRIKDLIVTAGGKKVAPQPIEGRTTLSPFVAQAIMVGDRRPFPAMLVVPDFDRLIPWAAEHGITDTTRVGLSREPSVRELLEQETLGRLQDLAQFERPKRIAILTEDLTIDSGLLTPTLKVRRRIAEHRFREVIEALYAGEDASGSHGSS